MEQTIEEKEDEVAFNVTLYRDNEEDVKIWNNIVENIKNLYDIVMEKVK